MCRSGKHSQTGRRRIDRRKHSRMRSDRTSTLGRRNPERCLLDFVVWVWRIVCGWRFPHFPWFLALAASAMMIALDLLPRLESRFSWVGQTELVQTVLLKEGVDLVRHLSERIRSVDPKQHHWRSLSSTTIPSLVVLEKVPAAVLVSDRPKVWVRFERVPPPENSVLGAVLWLEPRRHKMCGASSHRALKLEVLHQG
jgi:hypothetical protein